MLCYTHNIETSHFRIFYIHEAHGFSLLSGQFKIETGARKTREKLRIKRKNGLQEYQALRT